MFRPSPSVLFSAALAVFSVAPSASATVYTYTGNGAANGSVNLATSWNPNGVPAGATTAAGPTDVAIFDGTAISGALTPSLSAAFGNTAANGTTSLGVDLTVTSGQTAPVTFITTTTGAQTFRMHNFTVAAGAGAVTFGSDGTNGFVTASFGGTGTDFALAQNSANGVFFNNASSALGAGGTAARNLTITGTGNVSVNGAIFNALSLIKGADSTNADTGTLYINPHTGSVSTYTGTLTINGGSVVVGTSDGLGAASTTTAGVTTLDPTILGGGANTGTLVLLPGGVGAAAGAPATTTITTAEPITVRSRSAASDSIINTAGVNTLNGAITLDTQAADGSTYFGIRADGGTLNITQNFASAGTSATAKTLAFSGAGNINVTGNVTDLAAPAVVSVTKTGGGILTLAGTGNTYTGTTTVGTATIPGGTLLITGALSSSAVTVSNGTLGGTGSIANAVTIGGAGTGNAVLQPGLTSVGAAIGTLATGNLALNVDSTFALTLNSTAGTISVNTVTGALSIATGAKLVLTDLGATRLATGTALPFLPYSGAYNGGLFTVNGVVITNNSTTFTLNGNTYRINYAYNGNSVALITAAVPEPSTLALVVITAGGALLVSRRRNQRA